MKSRESLDDAFDDDDSFVVGRTLQMKQSVKQPKRQTGHHNPSVQTPTKRQPAVTSPLLEKRQRAQGKNKGHAKERDAKLLRMAGDQTDSSDESDVAPSKSTVAATKTPQKSASASAQQQQQMSLSSKKRPTAMGMESVKTKALAALHGTRDRDSAHSGPLSAKSPFTRSVPSRIDAFSPLKIDMAEQHFQRLSFEDSQPVTAFGQNLATLLSAAQPRGPSPPGRMQSTPFAQPLSQPKERAVSPLNHSRSLSALSSLSLPSLVLPSASSLSLSEKTKPVDSTPAMEVPTVEAMRVARSLFDAFIADRQSARKRASERVRRWDEPDSESEEQEPDSNCESDAFLWEDAAHALGEFSVSLPSQCSSCFLFRESTGSPPTVTKKLDFDLLDFVWFHQLISSGSHWSPAHFAQSTAVRQHQQNYPETLLTSSVKRSFFYTITDALCFEDVRFASARCELLKILVERCPHVLFIDSEDGNDSESAECKDSEATGETCVPIPIRQLVAKALECACIDRLNRCRALCRETIASEIDVNFLARRGGFAQLSTGSRHMREQSLRSAEREMSILCARRRTEERAPFVEKDSDRLLLELLRQCLLREVKSVVNRLRDRDEHIAVHVAAAQCHRSFLEALCALCAMYGHRLGVKSELVERESILVELLDVADGLCSLDILLAAERSVLREHFELEQEEKVSLENSAKLEAVEFDALHALTVFLMRYWSNAPGSLIKYEDSDVQGQEALNYAQEILCLRLGERLLGHWFSRASWIERGNDRKSVLTSLPSSGNKGSALDGIVNQLRNARNHVILNPHRKWTSRIFTRLLSTANHCEHVKVLLALLSMLQSSSIFEELFFSKSDNASEDRLLQLVESLRNLRDRHFNPTVSSTANNVIDMLLEKLNANGSDQSDFDDQ